MIKGKILGKEFTEIDGEILCDDLKAKKYLESLYNYTTQDKGPSDGFPEYYFLEALKKDKKGFELIEYKEPLVDIGEVY